jgi:hypothetical protein
MAACCSKCVLIPFNVLFFLIGMVPFVIGIIALASPGTITTGIESIPGSDRIPDVINIAELIKSAAIYILVLGGAIAVIGFIGCCGAWCSIRWLLGLYITLIVIFIAAEVAIIVLAVFFPDMINKTGKELMKATLKEFKDDIPIFNDYSNIKIPNDTVSAAWHALQFQIGCCGVENSTDYKDSKWSDQRVLRVPVSCCQLETETADLTSLVFSDPLVCPGSRFVPRLTYINTKPCYNVISDLIDKSKYIVIGVFAGIIAFEIILIIMACCICNDERKIPR